MNSLNPLLMITLTKCLKFLLYLRGCLSKLSNTNCQVSRCLKRICLVELQLEVRGGKRIKDQGMFRPASRGNAGKLEEGKANYRGVQQCAIIRPL